MYDQGPVPRLELRLFRAYTQVCAPPFSFTGIVR